MTVKGYVLLFITPVEANSGKYIGLYLKYFIKMILFVEVLCEISFHLLLF